MNQIGVVKCCVCSSKVQRKHILCQECYPKYKEYFKEQWFIELVHSQRIQDFIDTQEGYSLDMPPPQLEIKNNTRAGMKINMDLVRDAKRLRSMGMSLRKIGKVLQVSYETVRKVLSIP